MFDFIMVGTTLIFFALSFAIMNFFDVLSRSE